MRINFNKLEPKKLEESFVLTTKLSVFETRKLCRWFNNQNLAVQVDIFTEQRNQFYKWQNIVNNKELLPVIAFYMAVSHFYNLEYVGTQKNKNMSIKNMEMATDLKIKQFKKMRIKVKKEKLLNVWAIVCKLKTQNFSFREISSYLRSKHRFEISHSYIRLTWKELENE